MGRRFVRAFGQNIDAQAVQVAGKGVDDVWIMIELHRSDGTVFFLNIAHIVTVETTPDTVISLYGGGKLRIKEPARAVCDLINAWFQRHASSGVVPLPPLLGGTEPDNDKDE